MPTKKKNTWYINSLFINPEYRRKGIASKLLNKIFSVADGDNIVLDINPQKTHLLTLYGNHGFVKKSVSKNHYRDGEDRVTLERKTTKKMIVSEWISKYTLYEKMIKLMHKKISQYLKNPRICYIEIIGKDMDGCKIKSAKYDIC